MLISVPTNLGDYFHLNVLFISPMISVSIELFFFFYSSLHAQPGAPTHDPEIQT